MSVLDTSGAVDLLLGTGAHAEVAQILREHGSFAAPDLIVFETLAVLRRGVLHGSLTDRRAAAALEDLGRVPLRLHPALPLAARAFELRENVTAGDALFVALAERLGEPLVTKDAGLARAIASHAASVEVRLL